MMTNTSGKRRSISGSPLRQQFAALLQQLLQRNAVRRSELVPRLGITASAVTQFLNGGMIPSQARLDQLFELLRPAAEEAKQLEQMAHWLRAGRDVMPSEANRKLFLLRCRSGMTTAELAERTGIPARRIDALENRPESLASARESFVLAEVLQCAPYDLSPYAPREASPMLEVAESGNLAMLPRIGPDEIRRYSPPERIVDFAARMARGFIARANVPPDTTAFFTAPAQLLGLPGRGVVTLALGEIADGEDDLPALGLSTTGKLRLTGESIFATRGGTAPLKWSIPLLEICYLPGERI